MAVVIFFCGVGSGAMASSSTLPSSGKAMVSLSQVFHGCRERYRFF